jgi:branched-chain amino acid transport system permease protein
MTLFIQTLVFGVLAGGVYALMSSGFALVFGVMRVINLAHGLLLILAAYLTWYAWDRTGIDPLLLGCGVSVVMYGVGWALYKTVVARVQRIDPELTLVASFGAAVAGAGVIALIAGTEARAATPSYFNGSYELGGIVVPQAQLYACAAAVLLLGGLYGLMTYTALGRSIRACATSRTGAELVGIDVERAMAQMFAIGCMTTGFGGAALAVLYQFVPDGHYVWIGRVLCVVVLGGLGSYWGAALGAVVLGLSEALTAAYWDPRWISAVPYILIIAVLVVRPQGLLGVRLRADGSAA